jgi:hypothetical protein
VNNSSNITLHQSTHTEALEARVSLALAARLRDSADAVPHDITERLRFARERAIGVAAQQRRAAAVAATVVPMGRSAALAGPPSVWWRLASALPLVLLLAGLVFIEEHHAVEQINVAAEIDSALLADDLPPDAYRDPGFGEYLRANVGP